MDTPTSKLTDLLSLSVRTTASLDRSERDEIVTLCSRAFGKDFIRRTPHSPALDLRALLTVEWRDGGIW